MTTSKGKNLRIAQELKEQILSGNYPVGSKLPSLAFLSKQFNATVVTMSRALDILENEGLIERVNGRGIFVKEQVKYRFAVVFDTPAELGLFAFKAVFMKYFIEYCHTNGYDYKVFEDINTARDCSRVRKYLLENSCNAILISSNEFAQGAAKYLHGIPIAPIGLYAYKDLATCIHSDNTWSKQAAKLLIEKGCQKIAFVTTQKDIHFVQHDSIKSQKEMYQAMSDTHPDIFQTQLYCATEPLPRSAYSATCNLLDKLPKDQKLGIIVTDSLLTHGVISATLQKQYNIGKDLLIISHALNGFTLSLFSIPVIEYQISIRKYIESIDFLIRDYCATGQLKKGLVKIFGKIVFPDDK